MEPGGLALPRYQPEQTEPCSRNWSKLHLSKHGATSAFLSKGTLWGMPRQPSCPCPVDGQRMSRTFWALQNEAASLPQLHTPGVVLSQAELPVPGTAPATSAHRERRCRAQGTARRGQGGRVSRGAAPGAAQSTSQGWLCARRCPCSHLEHHSAGTLQPDPKGTAIMCVCILAKKS